MRFAWLAAVMAVPMVLGEGRARAQERAAPAAAEPPSARQPAATDEASPGASLQPPTEREPALETCAPAEDGCFLDTEGRWRDFDLAYEGRLAGREPHYLRGMGEQLLSLGIGAMWYWLDRETNLVDWDRPGWKARFNGDAVRFDNNTFPVNFVWHAMSGSAFYALARSNDLNVGWSLFYSFTTSLLWEYVLEFREKISINDVIFTPGTGLVLGEFWHRLGRYVTSAPGGGTRAHRAFGWVFGLPQSAHDVIDRHPAPPPGTATDALGYDADLWHAMRTWYGFSLAAPNAGADFLVHELGYEGRFVALPGYLRPGRFQRFFHDADLTELRLRVGIADGGYGVDLLADTTLFGFVHQDIARTASGGAGAAVVVGTSIAYLYRNEEYDRWVDRQGLLDFPGLAFDVHAIFGRAVFHLRYRLHGEFGGFHGRAYPAWAAAHPEERTKTVLEREGYYFGWGWTTRVEAELRLPYAELGGHFRYGHFRSQEGYDRNQEELTYDVPASDAMYDYDAWVRVFPFERFGVGAYLELAARGQLRASRVGEMRERARLDRFQLSVGAAY